MQADRMQAGLKQGSQLKAHSLHAAIPSVGIQAWMHRRVHFERQLRCMQQQAGWNRPDAALQRPPHKSSTSRNFVEDAGEYAHHLTMMSYCCCCCS